MNLNEKNIEKKAKELLRLRNKVFILEFISKSSKSIRKECDEFGVTRTSYYNWRRKYLAEGKDGLKRKKPIAYSHPKKLPQHISDKILELRKEYQLGSIRITWYLERYHGIKISESSVYRTLASYGVNRLPKSVSRRAVHTKRYSKTVPGHQVQVDVKFIFPENSDNKRIKCYQYTAIDDATRIRALKIYCRHNQANAIDFIDYVIAKFPFRIHTIRTDRGHEFQAQFHWYVEDLGMRHAYNKPGSPQLNGKVERSH
jgi:transposase